MDHVPHCMDMPATPTQMRMLGHPANNPGPQHFSVSSEHNDLVDQMPTDPGFDTLMVQNNAVGNMESSNGSMGLSPNMTSSRIAHSDGVPMKNAMGQSSSLPVKRKADMMPMLNNSMPVQALFPNKLPASMGADVSSHGFMQPLTPHRRTGPVQPNTGSSGIQVQSTSNKKPVPNGPMSSKSPLQREHPTKKSSTQIESASKLRPESTEGVRSKMKDSLASALALAYQKPDNVSNAEKDPINDTANRQMPLNIQASQTNSALYGSIPDSGSGEFVSSKELSVEATTNDSQVLPAVDPPNESSIDGRLPFQEFQYTSMLPDEDVQFSDNFFVKDDLLQGNGLSWAFDFDMQMREGKDAQNLDKIELMQVDTNEGMDRGEQTILTPEDLAFEIEAELFKLFGGVNKKYKEKGRSLLFNLKDRNNPELRERVMSGEISPERLCSMSAEELASKELTEWRVAKAEEMAQMVVLPDTDVDVRRLVKKTHKGEYQVEFERDDSIVEEVSGGASVLTRPQMRKETKPHSPAEENLIDKGNAAVQKNVSENKEFSGSLQGMTMEELKDTEFLTPIVSLDEFMESFNSELPFEKLSADGAHRTSVPQEEKLKGANSQAIDHASGSPKDSSSIKGDFKNHEADVTIKSGGSPKQDILPSTASESKSIWEGILQLTISSSVTVRGLFQSGEKTSTEEWPPSLEIKGRVRLDAFSKFLQELPMSRTRAVMILQIALKDNSLEKQRNSLCEVVKSYVADERLGYAEPAPGVELYLCPSTPKMTEMLHKHMPEECPVADVSTENGLIGVVVWRRAFISNSSSPNASSSSSSSHHKHITNKQHSIPSTGLQNPSNVNVKTPSRPPHSVLNNNNPLHVKSEQQPLPEEDDDIPPGFGPSVARKDDDDLPEFNFSGNDVKPSVAPRIAPQNLHHKGGLTVTHRPVDQVRELIQKYGQSQPGTTTGNNLRDSSLGIEPWVDDDDDIPEWQPVPPQQIHHYHHHRLPVNPHLTSLANPHSPAGLVRPPPSGSRWHPPHGTRWRPN